MSSTIFPRKELCHYLWKDDLNLPKSMESFLCLKSTHEPMRPDCAKTSSSCHGCLTLLSERLLRSSAMPNHPWISGIILKRCIETRIMQLECSNSRKTSLACNRKENPLCNTLEVCATLCSHRNAGGHSIDWCWILYPELKPKFFRDHKGSSKGPYNSPHISNFVASSTSEEMLNFIANLATLINEADTVTVTRQRCSGSLQAF